MKTSTKSILVTCVSIVAAASIFCGLLSAMYFSMVYGVMKKTSPDSLHVAKLVRTQGIDVNFIVRVDGQKVFWSADFRPTDSDFREQIAWDKSGQVVVLEVAGERIFGYDVSRKKTLSDSEVLAVQFTPFEELGYEDELPRKTLTE